MVQTVTDTNSSIHMMPILTTTSDKHLPLDNHSLVRLEVLTSKMKPEIANKYNEAMDMYEADLIRAEKLGLTPVESKPKRPLVKVEYCPVYFNFTGIVIKTFTEIYDDVHQCNGISLEYEFPNEMETRQMNLKMEINDWLKLLTQLGATINELS